jgi:hypothetical protein
MSFCSPRMGFPHRSELVSWRHHLRAKARDHFSTTDNEGAFIPQSSISIFQASIFNLLMKPSLLALSLLALTSTTAFAHHGRDFILVEDYSCPCQGNAFFLGNFEWEKGNEGSEYGFSPSLMVGVLPQVSLSVETSFREEVGADWKYNSVTPSAHIQITPIDSKSPVRFGFSAGYQFAEGADAEPEEDHHEEAGNDAEEEVGHHHHEGASIHNHDANALIARFVSEADIGSCKAVLNIINVTPENGSAAWGYAVGVRRNLSESVSIGVEALGDFKSDGWQEIGAATYLEPIHNVTLKLGLSFGLTEATPDFSLRTGFVYRF